MSKYKFATTDEDYIVYNIYVEDNTMTIVFTSLPPDDQLDLVFRRMENLYEKEEVTKDKRIALETSNGDMSIDTDDNIFVLNRKQGSFTHEFETSRQCFDYALDLMNSFAIVEQWIEKLNDVSSELATSWRTEIFGSSVVFCSDIDLDATKYFEHVLSERERTLVRLHSPEDDVKFGYDGGGTFHLIFKQYVVQVIPCASIESAKEMYRELNNILNTFIKNYRNEMIEEMICAS